MLLVNSLQAWQECEQQTAKNHSHTNFAVSRQVYVHALLGQHLLSVFFQYMVLVWSNVKNSLDAKKAEN